MAESFDKRSIPAISDDTIKEALKTELSSIKASEILIKNTINICHDEIMKGMPGKKGKLNSFLPWVYRLGAPLAAGALILVLVFNGNQMYTKQNASEMAPMASYNTAADSAVPTDDDRQMKRSADSEIYALEAPAPDPAPAEAPSAAPSEEPQASLSSQIPPSEDTYGTIPEEGSNAGSSKLNGVTPDKSILNSRVTGEVDGKSKLIESPDTINAIVALYNSKSGQNLSLYKEGITRIHTLIPTGISINMLREMENYRELLSGGGYWAVPLNGEDGRIAKVLYVSDYDENANIPVSDSDILYSAEDGKYLITEGFAPAGFTGLLNQDALIAMAREKGYGDVSDIIVADINYGKDFLVFITAGEEQLLVPFLRNAVLLGLQNNQVYTPDEIIEIFSVYMGQ